jgi:hypothetical protein
MKIIKKVRRHAGEQTISEKTVPQRGMEKTSQELWTQVPKFIP